MIRLTRILITCPVPPFKSNQSKKSPRTYNEARIFSDDNRNHKIPLIIPKFLPHKRPMFEECSERVESKWKPSNNSRWSINNYKKSDMNLYFNGKNVPTRKVFEGEKDEIIKNSMKSLDQNPALQEKVNI